MIRVNKIIVYVDFLSILENLIFDRKVLQIDRK